MQHDEGTKPRYPKKTCYNDLEKAKEKIKVLKADYKKVLRELWVLQDSRLSVIPNNERELTFWKNQVDILLQTCKTWQGHYQFMSNQVSDLKKRLKESDDNEGEEWKELSEREIEHDFDYSDWNITDIKRFKKPKHLICINPGDPELKTGLEFLERYVATGTCIADGDQCYFIGNWNGSGKERIKLVSRFIIPKNPPKGQLNPSHGLEKRD